MKVIVSENKSDLGTKAAEHGADLLRKALAAYGRATIIVATGASQFEMLERLVKAPGIHWPSVTCFHLDEYVGLPITHPASFRKYLWERFVSRLPLPLQAFFYISGEGDAQAECKRLADAIGQTSVDVAFVGIGENGHLAFNDPPADFETEAPYLVVTLDKACREQQMGEGWFPTLQDVPEKAISMSCKQIMKSKAIVVSVPDARKAAAVKGTLQGPVTPTVPASILQRHPNATLFLDPPAASQLAR